MSVTWHHFSTNQWYLHLIKELPVFSRFLRSYTTNIDNVTSMHSSNCIWLAFDTTEYYLTIHEVSWQCRDTYLTHVIQNRKDMTSDWYSVIVSKYKNETTSISNTNKNTWCLPFLKRQWIHRYSSYTTQKKKEKDDAKFNITFI